MEKDSNIYIKEGRKYIPIGYEWESNHRWLGEGIWLVSKHKAGISTKNGNYLKETYGLDKVGDIPEFSFAEIGAVDKVTEEIVTGCAEKLKSATNYSELVSRILWELKKYQDEQKEN